MSFTNGLRGRLAYERTEGDGPGVVFLGGFKSDMTGTKAVHLEEWAKARGRAFLRLDYGGHGASDGVFEDGSIGDWYEDALAVIDAVTEGPQVIVGSSMGGWISLLIARERPALVAGLVTIAAAPDFTEDGSWAGFSDTQRAELESAGVVLVPSEYGDPYPITKRLIEDGRTRLVLRTPLALDVPVRMLQGTADADVPMEWALRLLAHVEGSDVHLRLVKGADHRFSGPDELALIEGAVEEVLGRI
ncbi:alpha/beta hydrolase [Aestuariibius sp. 2305UL40-4]|uniref:alpha/beta hydrolase n=1 Tax=Aestuariibius violaceus TaxID=3234132 RepID=UPI00345EF23F